MKTSRFERNVKLKYRLLNSCYIADLDKLRGEGEDSYI